MWSGWVVWVWVWAGLTCGTHTHSTHEDPYLNPDNADVLTELRLQPDHHQPSNHLALEVVGGPEAATTLAQKYDLHYVCQVFSDPPVYHLHKPVNHTTHHHHHHHHHRERRSTLDIVQLLANEPGVKWVNQQPAFTRDKRHILHGLGHSSSSISKTTKQTYTNMRQWQQEEELGLPNDLAHLLNRRKTRANYPSANTEHNSILSDIFHVPAEETDTEKQHSTRTSNEEESSYNDSPEFNDPLFKDQWYLLNTGQLGHVGYDLNVTGAWRQGYTGRGLTICVLDDGFQTTNADLAANYNSAVSYSLVRDGRPEDDPSPRLDPPEYTNSHGTYCAAVVAAVANNGVCGVGVAYDAKVGGVRIVDGTVTDVQEATALSRHVDAVDIFSASWGPRDDGAHLEAPGMLARRALLQGVMMGRGGLGAIYVWASGNGGLADDNCNLDGYASSIYTLTVSALTDVGQSTFYSEPCASTLAGVYVGGQHSLQAALDTRSRKKMVVVVPELDGHCSNRFQGSSAAAPLMAGVVALILQANPKLGWRDVQHLVVEEAAPTPAALTEDGWHTNAHGKKFHLLQGFGAVNAGRMVEAALAWKNVGPQRTENLVIFEGRTNFSRGWVNMSQEVSDESPMTSVEHVVATISLNHPQRKLLNIYIVSPSGTVSQVLTHRSQDNSTTGFHGWGFMSVHFWGERPAGVWTVAIKSDSQEIGHLIKILLTVYGY